MFPPINITITKGGMLRFQPQERIELDFFNKSTGSGSCIFEYTVIPFLPNYPNCSKPDCSISIANKYECLG